MLIVFLDWCGRFQSTLPRGERLEIARDDESVYEFQSTLPRGERLEIQTLLNNDSDISIHAPAWGATHDRANNPPTRRNFNPRSRVGSDMKPILDATCGANFNPRSRVGSDSARVPRRRPREVFQSTLPRGERQGITEPQETGWSISIHAPAWGATRAYRPALLLCEISIHAPAWGATQCQAELNRIARISIHAPAWGATPIVPATGWMVLDFNPRSRVGSDKRYRWNARTKQYFNPRSRVGSDVDASCASVCAEGISIHAPAWGATCQGR